MAHRVTCTSPNYLENQYSPELSVLTYLNNPTKKKKKHNHELKKWQEKAPVIVKITNNVTLWISFHVIVIITFHRDTEVALLLTHVYIFPCNITTICGFSADSAKCSTHQLNHSPSLAAQLMHLLLWTLASPSNRILKNHRTLVKILVS